MDGGRRKWIEEERPLSLDIPDRLPADYAVPRRNDAPIRAFRDEVVAHLERGGRLVDVRSPEEYSGTLLHMPDYPQEGALRGGHIPGAASVPWKQAANEDGTFKGIGDLKEIYFSEIGLERNEEVIAYCRIGERSSHTWFVLTYLLGFPNVRNYDGSWTEWGNLVGAPIER
jgi:thiosulfate/3-mercaptopyruvate sulfurtransferase